MHQRQLLVDRSALEHNKDYKTRILQEVAESDHDLTQRLYNQCEQHVKYTEHVEMNKLTIHAKDTELCMQAEASRREWSRREAFDLERKAMEAAHATRLLLSKKSDRDS